jgi:glycosyltransferase involved in cell wall biosynthesis/pyruvate/2-oxoglutarate dehydrogenase complex dihydrolipoamide acyltransferase (E2) component
MHDEPNVGPEASREIAIGTPPQELRGPADNSIHRNSQRGSEWAIAGRLSAVPAMERAPAPPFGALGHAGAPAEPAASDGPAGPLSHERPGRRLERIATAELEHVLCNPASIEAISRVMPPAADAWSATFPDLTSIPRPNLERTTLSICIATEDIVGPVRNGGIGTTYAALAEFLAGAGHDTTILYLRGHEVENGSIEQWVEHYAARGVKFVPVPNYAARDAFQTGADRWLRAPYNMMRYLIDHPMDVVHVSEWHGSGYLSLLAKRQGLAFQDTLFIVKTSSPWLWNRLYGSQTLERFEDLAKIHAERRSVELADMVIGGSLHLLRWMLSQGYRVPRDRTFVQPNLIRFDHLKPLIGRCNRAPGARTPIEEFVFFGRLEARKGLFTFCQAVRRLIRQGVTLPPRISFMGKPGAKLSARPQQDILDYIESVSRSWPTKVEILTEFQQQDAIEYLLGGARLAVMPSGIENSSLAVYEAAICGIPFVASGVGGTPELIRAEDHAHVLCPPHPIPLADKLAEALRHGAYVAAASFDNEANLGVWRDFHDDLAKGLARQLARRKAASLNLALTPSVAVCIYHAGDVAALTKTLASIENQEAVPEEVLIAVDGEEAAAAAAARRLADASKLRCRVVDAYDHDAGLAFNLLAEAAESRYLLFLWEGAELRSQAVRVLERGAFLSGAEVLNFFYRQIDESRPADVPPLKAVITGSIGESFFRTDITAQPLFVARQPFLDLGGFTTDYRVLGYEAEFMAKAQLAGLHCETALMELASVPAFRRDWLYERCYDETITHFRAIRPQLAGTPLALRDLLLMAKGLSGRMAARGRGQAAGEGKVGAAKPAAARKPAEPRAGAAAGPAKAPAPRPARPQSGSVESLIHLLDLSAGGGSAARSARPAPEAPRAPSAPEPATQPAAKAAARFKRRLLYVRGGVVCGWAVDTHDPQRKLAIEALCDGRVVARSAAGGVALPATAEPMLATHGFALRLLPKWMPRLWRGVARSFDVRIADSNVFVARGLKVSVSPQPIAAAGFDGYCDASDEGLVQGWVWQPENPDAAVELAIFVDGRFVARARGDQFREDLAQKHIGTAEYGFRMRLANTYLDGKEHRIDVLIAGNGARLKGAPLIVQGRRVRPEKRYLPRALALVRDRTRPRRFS